MYKEKDFDTKFKPRELTETQEVGFIKKDSSWYADLPDYLASGGTFESCVMVAGSDQLIEWLAKGKDEVTLIVSLKPLRTNNKLDHDVLLVRESTDVELFEDAGGATYSAMLPEPQMFVNCWLCTVNTFVFGGTHPEIIFVKAKE